MRLPHLVDYYSASTSQVDGAMEHGYTLVDRYIPAFVQNALADVMAHADRWGIKITHSMYIDDATVYGSIGPNDRIVYKGGNYRVKAKKDLAGLGTKFRLDLEEEQ